MLDEEMDHMIRDAAENHHPVYNDKAWDKMEKMLDKHLPQKRDGRRYAFFLLLFLLLGGGVLFSVYKLNQDKAGTPAGTAEQKKNEKQADANTAVQPKSQDQDKNAVSPTGISDANAPKTNSSGNFAVPAPAPPANTSRLNVNPPVATGNTGSNNGEENLVRNKRTAHAGKGRSKISITAPGAAEDELAVVNDKKDNQADKNGNGNKGGRVNKKDKGRKNITVTAAAAESEDANEKITASSETAKEEIRTKEIAVQPVKEEQKKEAADQAVKEEQKKEEAVKEAETEKKKTETVVENKKTPSSPDKKKQKNTIPSNFGITVSVGPDISFVSLDKLGKATLIYGAGLSYDLGKRVTVRTGFYASKKIYDAKPDQYHTPGGNYPYLYNVAAACKVYEIPVSISYNFGQRKKHSWFGNIGLSSFLMKTEDYNYQYKTPAGQYYNYAAAVKDQNKHYFSVLTLSAGYKYKLGRRVSLQAEPYFKLPLGGVGAGKVRLNSSGILFTATIKPFARKE